MEVPPLYIFTFLFIFSLKLNTLVYTVNIEGKLFYQVELVSRRALRNRCSTEICLGGFMLLPLSGSLIT